MSDKDDWIRETQMFQRIAGITETPSEELEREWNTFKPRRKKQEVEHIKTHRVIQDAAIVAGNNRSK